MRQAPSPRGRGRELPLLPDVPLLEDGDLPDDGGWLPPDAFAGEDGAPDDDRYATLNVARAFDD